MSGCNHRFGKGSSLQLLQVRSVIDEGKWRYVVACKGCGRMTEWYKTILESKAEAHCGCWMEER